MQKREKTREISLIKRRLQKLGWQSWNTGDSSFFRLPVWNYCPIKDDYLPSLDFRRTTKKPTYGWCSWYYFWRSITEKDVVSQVMWFSRNRNIPVEYILIDEGWCRWGDWLTPDLRKFPSGMKNLSKKIKKYGFKPGLWIAPFVADKKSLFYKKHKDWYVRHRGFLVPGWRMTNFGFLSMGKYLLDVRKKEVMDFIKKCIDEIITIWGYELIKLDFLYAPFFIPGINSDEAASCIIDLLGYIKEKYPKVYTMASGCPLTVALGVIDSMRIGPDTIPYMVESLPLISNVFSGRIKKVIKNIEERRWTSKFWNLDPDVFVCRKSLGLSDDFLLKFMNEIKRAKGNIFLGDDMTKLSSDRIEKFILPLFANDSED